MRKKVFDFKKHYNVNEIELPLQFVVSKYQIKNLKNFSSIQFNGINISVHHKLKRNNVISFLGEQVGLFLGSPIALDQEQIVANDIFLNENMAFDGVPAFLDNFAGSYIFIYFSNGRTRIYLDADGTMSLIYDPVTKQAGSTAAVLLDEQSYFERLRSEQFEHLDILNLGWYPSGITAHEGIDRLLCNHYLDLTTWQPVRFWPNEGIVYSQNPQEEVCSIRKETTKVINALTKSHNIMQSLTAGYETRFLLACSKDFVEKISFFTIIGNKVDVDIAKKMSREFNLHLTPLPKLKANISQQKEWLYRVGHTVGGTNLMTHPSINNFRSNTILSIGLGGEVGRGFFWKKSDNAETCATAELIVGRFGLPSDKLILEKTKDWLATLPSGLDIFTILDLAYLELRMSAWAYAQSYAQDSICPHISPMISYKNYKSMFNVAPEKKKAGYILKQGISDGWPELMKYPINHYGGWKDVVVLVNKLLSPKRVISKVRKLISS